MRVDGHACLRAEYRACDGERTASHNHWARILGEAKAAVSELLLHMCSDRCHSLIGQRSITVMYEALGEAYCTELQRQRLLDSALLETDQLKTAAADVHLNKARTARDLRIAG